MTFAAASGPVVISALDLTHTTPRPDGEGPAATVQVFGLPLTLAPGEEGQLMVSGDYALVQVGATQRANLHFCATGASETSGQSFGLGINAHLRGPTSSVASSELADPPVLSDIEAIPGPASIIVRWTTNQATGGQVIVGIGPNQEDPIVVSEGCEERTEHSVEIKGLDPEVEYTLHIRVRNSDGVTTLSQQLQATPLAVGNERIYLPTVWR